MTKHAVMASFLAAALAGACAVEPGAPGGPGASSGGGKADGPSPGLPATLPPWGGDDPGRWSPEAIVANAATQVLRDAPDAVVSVPAALWTSGYAPFGDGQTDAAVDLAGWAAPRPPVVAVRRGRRVSIVLDRALGLVGDGLELWSPSGAWVATAHGAPTGDGGWAFELDALPAPLGDDLVVSPSGWRDGFPLSFRVPRRGVDDLAATLPAPLRRLPGGAPVVDPAGIAAAAAARGSTAAAALRATDLEAALPGAGFGARPYRSDEVHAVFPTGGRPRVTAIGGASTWLTLTPFKDIYICFDRRRPEAEARDGVPSGAGWHRIGDAGESILASLEDAPLLIGHAASAAPSPPGGGSFAYGLDHALAFALLAPGEAFTTTRGDFHWYAVHHEVDPCVQIWLHRCAPDPAAPSMACPGE